MTTELSETEKPRRHYTGSQVFPIVAALMFGVSILLWWPVLQSGHDTVDQERLLVGAAILLAAFLAGELFPLQIEVRRETLLVSGSELPMVLGLLLLPAWTVGVTHVAAGALVFLIRRDSWRNIAVNLSFITVETGTAAVRDAGASSATPDTLRRHAVPGGRPRCAGRRADVRGRGRADLPAARARRAAGPGHRPRRCCRPRPSSRSRWSASPSGRAATRRTAARARAVCIALAAVLGVLYRTYFLFLRQHADLTRMYSFGRQVTNVGSSIDDWRGVLEQVRDQLNAEVGGAAAERRRQCAADAGDRARRACWTSRPHAENDPLLTTARMTGRARASTDRTPTRTCWRRWPSRKAWDVLVVPLRSGDRDRGYLEVRDRLSRWGRFRDEDLQLLETLSGHVATALDNLRLLETLRHEAYHDAITGLRNRLGLHVEVQAAMTAGLGRRHHAGRARRVVAGQQRPRARPRGAAAADGRRAAGRAWSGEDRPVARIEARPVRRPGQRACPRPT